MMPDQLIDTEYWYRTHQAHWLDLIEMDAYTLTNCVNIYAIRFLYRIPTEMKVTIHHHRNLPGFMADLFPRHFLVHFDFRNCSVEPAYYAHCDGHVVMIDPMINFAFAVRATSLPHGGMAPGLN